MVLAHNNGDFDDDDIDHDDNDDDYDDNDDDDSDDDDDDSGQIMGWCWPLTQSRILPGRH